MAVRSFRGSRSELRMDTGTGSRSKVLAAIFLSASALILTARTIRTEAASSSAVTSFIASGKAAPVGKGSREFRSFDPTIHLTKLAFSESQDYEGSGHNIFSMLEERPKKIRDEKQTSSSPALETAAIAPLSLSFYGFAIVPKNPRKVFIRDEDALFIACEGDIVDRRYRIAKIGAGSVELEDLIEHRLHTLTLPHLTEVR